MIDKTLNELMLESGGDLVLTLSYSGVGVRITMFRGILTVMLWPDKSLGLHRGHFEPDEEERAKPLSVLLEEYKQRLAPVV